MAIGHIGCLTSGWLGFCLLVGLPFIAESALQNLCGPQEFTPCKSEVFYQSSPPEGIEKLYWEGRYINSAHPTARLCLNSVDNGVDGYIASLYDCRLRIPIWTAMSLSAQEFRGPNVGRSGFNFMDDFPPRLGIARQYQQESSDYASASRNHGIDKGHMIAANYAGYYVSGSDASLRRARARVRTSFSYYNAVPQYQYTNRGEWRQCEQQLLNWAINKSNRRTSSTRLYILAGSVPSVHYLRMSGVQQRNLSASFLSEGDLQPGGSGINVPQATWTGTCTSVWKGP